MSNFLQQKQGVFSRKDKSSIGELDEHILKLCEIINLKENYYTTSSCSGRIIVMIDQDKKGPGLFKFVSHDLVEFKELKKEIEKIKERDLKFKSEPPILHIACKTLEDAEKLLKKSQESGWKRSGIISIGKNVVVEMIGTEKIEFPFMKDGKVLVDDNFLKIVLEKANKNLEKAWSKIERLENSLK